MAINEVGDQFQRLERHYQLSLMSYDKISLLDLSHTLRIWTELANRMSTIAPEFAKEKAFKQATPTRPMANITTGHEHILAYFAGGIKTFASEGHILSVPGVKPGEKLPPHSMLVTLEGDRTAGLKFHSVGFVAYSLNEAIAQSIVDSDRFRPSIKPVTISQWMDSEAVRLQCLETNGFLSQLIIIPRGILIRRVANILDGSHPSAGAPLEDQDNRYDGYVRHLLKYSIGGAPAPYFIILKAAHDILSALKPYFK